MSVACDTTGTKHVLLEDNDPGSVHWKAGSFVERLCEEGIFDADAYLALEAACIDAAVRVRDTPSLVSCFRIFERISLLLRCHLDPCDAFRIDDVDDEDVREFDNRLRHVFCVAMEGEAPDVNGWTLPGR